ncbi:HalOD1 output domain-containing protein [Haladaptatus caseinilyticus]|uniref:HalOD1 output domain-containing protein n=1 Tax=Haladaptatus caseinilyticus TaxID=2993314 RepID=UPI00224B3307|nr:HalOD1 output domain-containing protein [Haladaptatus caseinilyticus]
MTNHTPPSDDEDEHADDAAYQTEFDPIRDSVSEELITAIATLNDADPTELALLSDFVDPEALDALFGPRDAGNPRETNGHVLFNYDAYHVKVDSSGQITVHNSESSSDSKQSPSDE